MRATSAESRSVNVSVPALSHDAGPSFSRERSNVFRLATAQALAGANSTVVYATGAVSLLGIGWNFGFIGASAMVLECHRPEERARVQSLNDFVVFGTMTVGSFLSGGLLSSFGWSTVLVLSFAPLLTALLALIGFSYRPVVRQS